MGELRIKNDRETDLRSCEVTQAVTLYLYCNDCALIL